MDATFGHQQNRYPTIDFGADSLTLKKPHLWTTDYYDKKTRPHCSWRPMGYASCKSESKFSYYTTLMAIRKYARLRWDVDLPLTAAIGDPMKSLTAAALAINPECICPRDDEHVRR